MMRRCPKCDRILPISQFYIGRGCNGKNYPSSRCKECDTKYARIRRNNAGTQIPLSEAKNIGAYLGVHIAERLLGKIFKTTIRMPYGNPGYDLICGQGFKIDVKAACRIHRIHCPDRWKFNIKKNKIADYFACFAISDRKFLNPEHFWLIPAHVINEKSGIQIFENLLNLWNEFEQPIEGVHIGCAVLKGVPA